MFRFSGLLLASYFLFVSCNYTSEPDPLAADTNFNKEMFFKFFKFKPTSDIKHIYCYADEIGIDASYWFNFSCSDITFQKIIYQLDLRPNKHFLVSYDMEGNVLDSTLKTGSIYWGGLNSVPTPWWDTSFINKEIPYEKVKGDIHRYLWYDKSHKTVYYLTFDT
jgi:hypothetical protein